jgi:hypothetical protein
VTWDRIKASLAFGVAACALLALSSPAWATTYAPNRTSDHAPNGCTRTDCTLREAITKANGHPGLDTIVLKGGKTYELGLDNTAGDEDLNATGDLDVLGSVAIKSSNKKLATVDANGIDRVFEVGPASPVSAAFKRVVIRGGQSAPGGHGGGIESFNGGVLTLIRSKVVGNTAADEGGGISADEGTLKVIRSVIAHNLAAGGNAGGIEGEPNNGDEVISISRSRIVGNRAHDGVGGVYAYQDATITKSTIANNHAENGPAGGVENYGGTLRITSSTLSGNTSTDVGGAIENGGLGSAVTLVNDTITKNHTASAGGAIANFDGTTSLNVVTIARNSADTDGGGIDSESGVIKVDNSLIALNSKGSGFGPDCVEANPGGIVSGGHNLVGTTADCTGTIFTGATHDITNVNPGIAQLASNGGPTKTIALKRGSKAINHAGPDAPARDQRSVTRHKPDIGAFERR